VKNRPWIWLIVGTLLMMSASITMVVIAVRNQEPSVSLEPHGH
jgi:hypothetical protein